MKKVLFLDRDGTLIVEPEDQQVDSFEKLRLLPGVVTYLGRIVAELDYELVMVTNQDGLGADSFPESDFDGPQNFLLKVFEGEGIRFEEVLVDRSFEHESRATRKPGTAMLSRFLSNEYDIVNSFVIGDRMTDVQLAKNLGARAIYLGSRSFQAPADPAIALLSDNWREIYEFLLLPPRRASYHRTTKETDVRVEIDLDGKGCADVSSGLPFFDHMLEQFARHSGIDMTITAIGDLHVDEHHTIEDVAITLGEAFSRAIGDKRGMQRYGFWLPMDDCLARVVVDLGGRNWVVWDAEFKREMIGGVPSEMFFHFFKSFTDHAKCNLNIMAQGTNEHHKIESIFKAFAKAMGIAVKRGGSSVDLPSTKGVI